MIKKEYSAFRNTHEAISCQSVCLNSLSHHKIAVWCLKSLLKILRERVQILLSLLQTIWWGISNGSIQGSLQIVIYFQAILSH